MTNAAIRILMPTIVGLLVGVGCFVLAAGALGQADSAKAKQAEPAAAPQNADRLATLEGTVIYKADANRPWRYARHYVQWPARGHLAEAVVALRGTGLTARSPAKQVTVDIDQRDFRFVPEAVAIHAGDRVRFTNSDVQVHNVRTNDGLRPFNVNTPMGGEYVHEFERAGGISHPIRIGCSYHAQMRAWIFVFPHRFYALTGADGKFRWTDVPPGEYELQVMHPAGGLLAKQQVSLRAGSTDQTDIMLSPDNLVPENLLENQP